MILMIEFEKEHHHYRQFTDQFDLFSKKIFALLSRLLWILAHTGPRSDSLRPTIHLLICLNLTYPSVIILVCNGHVRYTELHGLNCPEYPC